MAEQDTTPITEGTTSQTAPMEPSGSGSEPRTFTQEDVDRIVKERLARAKATPPADYEEFKAKAAKYDELAEAQKSDLEKANDAAAKAQAEAADWKAKFETAQAEQERQQTIAAMASQYKVDLGALSRMGGDVEDNAKYLASLNANRPKYGQMPDAGQQPMGEQSLEDALKGAKNANERIRIRAEFNARNRN
jgi:hypothetical protein